jgi:hypothetical protein
MATVVERLKNDLMFAADYLNDPRKALQGYDLAPAEYQALVARSVEDLQKLSVSKEDAFAALSGTHSRQCTSRNCTD